MCNVPYYCHNPDDDDNKKKEEGEPASPKRRRKEALLLDPMQEEELVAWYRANPSLYDSSHRLHKSMDHRLTLFQAKAQDLGIKGMLFHCGSELLDV